MRAIAPVPVIPFAFIWLTSINSPVLGSIRSPGSGFISSFYRIYREPMRKILPVVDCEVHVVHHIRSGKRISQCYYCPFDFPDIQVNLLSSIPACSKVNCNPISRTNPPIFLFCRSLTYHLSRLRFLYNITLKKTYK